MLYSIFLDIDKRESLANSLCPRNLHETSNSSALSPLLHFHSNRPLILQLPFLRPPFIIFRSSLPLSVSFLLFLLVLMAHNAGSQAYATLSPSTYSTMNIRFLLHDVARSEKWVSRLLVRRGRRKERSRIKEIPLSFCPFPSLSFTTLYSISLSFSLYSFGMTE